MTKHSKLYAIRREDNGKTLPVLQDKNLKQVYDPSGNVLKKRVRNEMTLPVYAFTYWQHHLFMTLTYLKMNI